MNFFQKQYQTVIALPWKTKTKKGETKQEERKK